jgi:ATP-dependent DNA helicase RecG
MMIRPENEHTENKSTLKEWRGAVISLAAFATAHGGTVRFGIDPDGRRVGVMLGQNTLENLANDIKLNTDPPLFPSITVEGEESAAVVLVCTEESAVKPVRAFGKPYKRVGRTNQVLSHEESHRLIEVTTGHTWDGLPCAGLKPEDLSRSAIDAFLQVARQPVDTPTDHVLENLRLRLADGRLCNAAALLFADTPGRFLMGGQVQCGLYADDLDVNLLDEQILDAPLIGMLTAATAFVARHTRKTDRGTGTPPTEPLQNEPLQSEEMTTYPEEAVREAIINALIHRDYGSAGRTRVCLYPERLEIWNPAILPYDIPVEGLYRRHPSRPRNRKLADAFLRAGLITQWGMGTMRMQEACAVRGLPAPRYEQRPSCMGVTLYSCPKA